MGALILAAGLVVLAGLGPRRVPALALPAVAIVGAGAVAVGSATASQHPLVHWQSWNLAHAGTGAVGVDFVWNARYDGLKWPSHPTVVLDVQSRERPSYLRAAVLDDFVGDRWKVGLPRPADFLEPAAALRGQNLTRELVTVEGLANRELVGGSIPVRYVVGGTEIKQAVRGLVSLDEGVPSNFQYTVWSYSPQVTAAELRRSPPDYPAALIRGDLLDVGRDVPMPTFRAPDRAGQVQALLAANPDLYPYRPLARLADKLAGSANTPYDAVARLERWFLDSGGFTYSNHPTVISPPLVGFVTQTRSGYCQYFAGAMTLMLRYLGIPARVAVGFAGGTYSARRHAWLVTDLDSHAWVEVWFKGYGWLPFDPTPPVPGSTRLPSLPGSSVPLGSGGPPVVPTFHGTGDFGGKSAVASKLSRQNGLVRPHTAAGPLPVVETRGKGVGTRAWPVLLLLLALGAAAGAILAAKAGFRLKRWATREPRRVAAACREELALFLVDQRIAVPPSATVRELGELVRFEFGAEPGPFVAAASAARFAPSDAAAPAARTARRELRALLDDARRGLTRRERIRGLFSVRSLARSATAVDASASLESVSVGS
jgi:transglutaminase-like putative cysteine protease